MTIMPAPLKETRPAEEVVRVFLNLRNVSADQVITSRTMIRPIARVRHELMWLLRDLTFMTLEEIGQALGGRDLTTVKHGVEAVADRIAEDDGYRREMLFARAVILRGPTPGLTPDLCLTAVQAVLTNGDLSDAEARKAALQLMEARRG